MRPLSCTPDVELAFALDRSCWDKGYATEAATAVIDAAFVCLRFESVVGTVYPENVASQRVLAKLGMKFERKVFRILAARRSLAVQSVVGKTGKNGHVPDATRFYRAAPWAEIRQINTT